MKMTTVIMKSDDSQPSDLSPNLSDPETLSAVLRDWNGSLSSLLRSLSHLSLLRGTTREGWYRGSISAIQLDLRVQRQPFPTSRPVFGRPKRVSQVVAESTSTSHIPLRSP